MKLFFKLFIIIISGMSVVQAQPYGLTERVLNTSLKISFAGDTLAQMEMERAFENLRFNDPIFLTHAGDGTNRLFVVEKPGVIQVFSNDQNAMSKKVFLDIENQVNSSKSESGLLGLAFHPDYAQNGKFYVSYNFGDLYSRISEFVVSDNPDSADHDSERSLLEVRQPYSNHNGGQISFGPDGYLYIAFGDGGSGGDPDNNGQDLKTLLGAILRVDVDNQNPGRQYAIPNDNPFVANMQDWKEEIWAYGLRNSWRFSFDRDNGVLWAGDVGQGRYEEVDIIEKGKNYGWKVMEGFHCYSPSSGCDTSGLSLPIIEYDHDKGKSITGGYVYRGTNPELQRLKGRYIYGDYVTRKIWALQYEDGQVIDNKHIATSPGLITSFGEDESGEIYVVGYDGRLYRFKEKEGIPPVNTVPETIAESGLYSEIASQTIAPGIIEYSVNSPLWSDDAGKERFLALPDTTKIEFSQNGFWGFPSEAVIVKNFYLELEKGNPDSKQMVETRFLVKQTYSEDWAGFSYMWNDEQTDAVLLSKDSIKTFEIFDPQQNQTYDQTWYFPSREDCFACHTPSNGFALGVQTHQMNRVHDYEGTPDNQLRSLNNIRYFTTDIGEDYTNYPKLPDPQDNTQSLENRALSYLDANCANCHLPAGSGRTNMDLRFATNREEMNIIDHPATLEDLGLPSPWRIRSGYPDSSVIYLRMLDLGTERMPPLATAHVDGFGSELIKDWIISLKETGLADKSIDAEKIASFELGSAYPNPFNASTTIRFTLPQTSDVELEFYNLAGKKIETISIGQRQSGQNTIRWNAANHDGVMLASGIYFYRLKYRQHGEKTHQFSKAGKLILIK